MTNCVNCGKVTMLTNFPFVDYKKGQRIECPNCEKDLFNKED